MIDLPTRLALPQALQQLDGRVRVWSTPSAHDWVAASLPWPAQDSPSTDADWLVVVGGGQMIDRAKALKLSHPGLKLAVVTSLWGSGAEASPVVVLDDAGTKSIRVDKAALPDLVINAPELAMTVPPERALMACGDAWSHALEGFLSPLASEALRVDLADVMRRMLSLPLATDARWFELSALACAGQSMSSVGLIHGIAHELEAPLRHQDVVSAWHHARLCATYLLPVMRYNVSRNDKWPTYAAQYGLESDEIWHVLTALHDATSYKATLPVLQAHWRQVLRNPCSRTNSALANADTLAFLMSFEAEP